MTSASCRNTYLIVEDEPAIRDMVAFALRKAGMEAAHAADARGAQSMIAERVPDLILLDWMLPGMSGLDLARRLRKEELTRDVPIIMLTARGEETDRVGGLEAGVDDYVVKPFSPRELIARINAVMRRTHGVDGDGVVEIGALRIDSARIASMRDGERCVSDRSDRIPPAAFFHDPRRARLFAQPAARLRLGRQRLRRGTHRRRAHPPPAQDPRTVSLRTTWCRPCAAPAIAFRRRRRPELQRRHADCRGKCDNVDSRRDCIRTRRDCDLVAYPRSAVIVMRLEFLQSHAWQVSLGRFVVLLAAALIVGLLLHRAAVRGARRAARLLDLVAGQPVPDPVLAALAPAPAAAGGSRRLVGHFCAHV